MFFVFSASFVVVFAVSDVISMIDFFDIYVVVVIVNVGMSVFSIV